MAPITLSEIVEVSLEEESNGQSALWAVQEEKIRAGAKRGPQGHTRLYWHIPRITIERKEQSPNIGYLNVDTVMCKQWQNAKTYTIYRTHSVPQILRMRNLSHISAICQHILTRHMPISGKHPPMLLMNHPLRFLWEVQQPWVWKLWMAILQKIQNQSLQPKMNSCAIFLPKLSTTTCLGQLVKLPALCGSFNF